MHAEGKSAYISYGRYNFDGKDPLLVPMEVGMEDQSNIMVMYVLDFQAMDLAVGICP